MADVEIKRAQFVERLTYCVNLFPSKRAFAKEVGIASPTLNGYLKDREPHRPTLVAMARIAGVHLQWLAEGIGPKFLTDASSGVLVPPNDEEFSFVPIHGVQASSGFGAQVFDSDESPESYVAFPISWLRSISSGKLDKLSIITNDGTSNEPEINDGDLVMIDRGATEVMTEGKYAVSLDNLLLIKQINKVSPSEMELISVNPAYRPQLVDLEKWDGKFRVIGKAIWVGRRI